MKKLLLTVWVALCLAAFARGQDPWTKVAVPTTANLWGVCYGGNQFVVVGEQGTILTSPDGTNWTQRTSGTTAWLNGVAWSGTLYVAVGDGGTILSSPDANTWTLRVTGGDRLNGIAYGNGRFVAVGENGTVRSSTDAIHWSTAVLPVGTWLHGVCFAADHFVIGAGDGTVCSTEDGLVFRFVAKLSTSIEALHFADGRILGAGGPATLYSDLGETLWNAPTGTLRGLTWTTGPLAVGTAGTVVVGAIDRDFPSMTTAETFTVAGRENLNAVAAGPRGSVIVGDAGAVYVRTVTPDLPRINRIDVSAQRSAGATVTLDPRLWGTAPFVCQWTHDGRPIRSSADGRLVIRNFSSADAGEYAISVANAAGTVTASCTLALPSAPPSLIVDPSFSASMSPPAYGSWAPDWDQIIPTPDGRFYLLAERHFRRLHHDGSWDIGFKPALVPQIIALQQDGRILAYRSDGGSATLVRLSRDGSVDPTFTATDSSGFPYVLPSGALVRIAIDAANIATVTSLAADGHRTAQSSILLRSLDSSGVVDYSLHAPVVAADEQGRLNVVATQSDRPVFPWRSGASCLFRLTAAGEIDRSLQPVAYAVAIEKVSVAAGKLCYDAEAAFFISLYRTHRYGKLNQDGTPYAGFAEIYGDPELNYLFPSVGCFDVQGRLVLLVGHKDDVEVRRYDAQGVIDSAPGPRITYARIGTATLTPDGSIVVGGYFSAINGVSTGGFARLRVATDHPATRLANLSIRTTAGSGDQTLIAGFVVGGSAGTRSLLLRGVGPGLIPLGLTAAEVVPDPFITLFRRGVAVKASDNWDALSLRSTADAVGAYPLTPGSLDAGLLETLTPGAYTVHVQSQNGAARIALVELYDADPAPVSAQAARLVNISGRAHVETGSNVLIAGFVITGQSTRRVLIRGIGPGLTAQGVTGVLANPELLIHRSGAVVGSNDDWDASLASVFRSVGAFALTEGSRDAALVMDLPLGVYTATVRGVGATTGNAMVEVYELP